MNYFVLVYLSLFTHRSFHFTTAEHADKSEVSSLLLQAKTSQVIITMFEPNEPRYFMCPLDVEDKCLATAVWAWDRSAVVESKAGDPRPHRVKKVLVKPASSTARLNIVSIHFDKHFQTNLAINEEDGVKSLCNDFKPEAWRLRPAIHSNTHFAIESTRFPKEFLTYTSVSNSVQLESFEYNDGEVQAVPRHFVCVLPNCPTLLPSSLLALTLNSRGVQNHLMAHGSLPSSKESSSFMPFLLVFLSVI